MMIRNKEHNGKNYILVYTTLQVEKGDTTLSVPVHLQVDITKLSEPDLFTVFNLVNKSYNRTLIFKTNKPAPQKPRNEWWRKIFR